MNFQRKILFSKACLGLTTLVLVAAYVVGVVYSESWGWNISVVAIPLGVLTILFGYVEGYGNVGREVRD